MIHQSQDIQVRTKPWSCYNAITGGLESRTMLKSMSKDARHAKGQNLTELPPKPRFTPSPHHLDLGNQLPSTSSVRYPSHRVPTPYWSLSISSRRLSN